MTGQLELAAILGRVNLETSNLCYSNHFIIIFKMRYESIRMGNSDILVIPKTHNNLWDISDIFRCNKNHIFRSYSIPGSSVSYLFIRKSVGRRTLLKPVYIMSHEYRIIWLLAHSLAFLFWASTKSPKCRRVDKPHPGACSKIKTSF